MVSRRDVLGSAFLSGLVGGHPAGSLGMSEHGGLPGRIDGLATADKMAGSDEITEQQGREIVQALRGLQAAVEAERHFAEIKPIRDRQVEFLRTAGKLPDFIDVGSDVWFAVHDWHVRHLQPIALGRDPSGHYTIALLQTQLVLRQEAQPTFIGFPYDSRQANGEA